MPANALNPEDQAFLVALDEQLQAASSDLRQHERHNERFAIRVIPADPSRAREEPARGRTLDISLGGFRAEVDTAPSIGDHYRVHILSDSHVPLSAFARCLRCSILGENQFEVVLRFFQPLEEDQLPFRRAS